MIVSTPSNDRAPLFSVITLIALSVAGTILGCKNNQPANGKLLYSQQAAEFGDMRYMYANSVTEFLNRWKA